MKIYLAGKIPKGKELDNYVDWRQTYREILTKELEDVKILDPDMNDANHIASEDDAEFWFGHDCNMIRESDLIIVKTDRKLGVGTSQEILIAKKFKKPVVVILPKDTHHRKTNIQMRSGGLLKDWIHPFIKATSDIVVENLEEAIVWIKEHEKQAKPIKTLDIIDSSMKYYQKIIDHNIS